MNPAAPFQPAALTTAVQRVKIAARDAALRCVDALGVAALASSKSGEREDLLAAQFELNRKQTAFVMSFNEKLDEVVAAELRRLDASNAKINSKIGSSWQSLSLVDDREVEIQVSAERVGMTLQHECEWELRELDTLMMGLLHSASRGPKPPAPRAARTGDGARLRQRHRPSRGAPGAGRPDGTRARQRDAAAVRHDRR
jgi:hypothetical protein